MARSRKRKRSRKAAPKTGESVLSVAGQVKASPNDLAEQAADEPSPPPAAKSGPRPSSRKPSPLEPPEPHQSPEARADNPGPSPNTNELPPVIRPLSPEAWHRGLTLALQIEEEERALAMPDDQKTPGKQSRRA